MTAIHEFTGTEEHGDDLSRRLLESAAELSYDPMTELDWDAPVPDDLYGLNPEWSTLYGTKLWNEMSEQQRIRLTMHEVCSIMSTGIWFEMILQTMILRSFYATDAKKSDFQFALVEVADECRHSLMFSKVCQKFEVPAYLPGKFAIELGRGYKTIATAEGAYGGILVAEEILDVMQRDWMRDERVQPLVRGTSMIHVVEESRHMRFAREEIREAVAGKSSYRRDMAGNLIAVVASVIVTNLVRPQVYANVGLDPKRAVREVRASEHRRTMLKTSSLNLMDFLADAGLLNSVSTRIFQGLHMI